MTFKKFAGHPHWWRDESFGQVYYRYQPNGIKSDIFIFRDKYQPPFKYAVYGSGMSKGGFALLLDGSNYLDEAIKLAEKKHLYFLENKK